MDFSNTFWVSCAVCAANPEKWANRTLGVYKFKNGKPYILAYKKK